MRVAEAHVNNDNEVVQLLKEIRDNQREEIAWRKKIMEESMRMQRAGLRWQRFAMLFGLLLIGGGVLMLAFAKQILKG
jgi:hypothetical protein